MSELSDIPVNKPIIALIDFDSTLLEIFNGCSFGERELINFESSAKLRADWTAQNLNIAAIIANSEIMGTSGLSLAESLKKGGRPDVPFLLVVKHVDPGLRKLALASGITEVLKVPLRPRRIEKRVNFLIDNWSLFKSSLQLHTPVIKKIELSKRIFDLFFAGMALLILSPLFLIIYILIKLESKGPAFYYALRVGSGYRTFKFYKFRSMYVDADQRIKDLQHLNQYNIDAGSESPEDVKEETVTNGLCKECQAYGKCQYPVHADQNSWCEKEFRFTKKASSGSAFFKIKNDPRITKVGNFIRNTSIDELPQLWNVIIGNMSIVGNRPLPLYEAEKLTTDKYILRFSAPAGITGLWQVEKRGKGEMSEEERLMLDNVYAQNHSLKNDIKLILRTIPALLQKENV